MKKLLKVLVGAIILFSISTNTAKAYNFSAVNSDGDTIYYNITSSTSPYTVAVTYNYLQDYSDSVNIPSTVSYNGNIYSVTNIGDGAFQDCSSLTSITIPNSVTSIGVYTFYGCSSLTSITIPNSVISIDYGAFYGCSSLTSITIGDSVTSIGNLAFSGCSSLTSITIPSSVTRIDYAVFSGCSSLTSINVSNGNTNYSSIDGVLYNKLQDSIICCPAGKQGSYTIPNNVTSIGNRAFDGCSSLTSITIPNSVIIIDYAAFKYCSSLTSITIPNSVTSIGDWAFRNCSGLTSITIPNSVTSISNWAFFNCSGLTSVTIPNSVTSIGEAAFDKDSSLTSITIPNSVTSIGEYAFKNCVSLNRIIINKDTVGGITTIESTTFDIVPDTAIIYVPCGSQTTYQTATNWSERSNYIRGLSNTLDTTIYICPGSSYQFGDSLLTTQGDYFDTVQSNSCYNPINLHLIISPTYNDTILATIHQGESYTFAGQQLTTAGIYYDSLQTVNGCDSIITLNLTLNSGLNEVNNDNISVSLYPNPTSNKATLSIEGLNENATLFIYDVQGREMMKKEINVGEKAVELNVKDFSKGVYNVRIVNNKDNTTKKLIIQ